MKPDIKRDGAEAILDGADKKLQWRSRCKTAPKALLGRRKKNTVKLLQDGAEGSFLDGSIGERDEGVH